MLQPPTPCCHSSLALPLPWHSHETCLCVCCRSGAAKLRQQGRLEQIQSLQCDLCHSCTFTVHKSSIHGDGQRESFHCLQWVSNSGQHMETIVIFCVMFFWNSNRGFPHRACHVEAALLERTDTVAFWSVHLSDLFCFTSLSNLIAQWSLLPLVLPTRWSDRDENVWVQGIRRQR